MASIQGSQVGLLWVPMRIGSSVILAHLEQVLAIPIKNTVVFPAYASSDFLEATSALHLCHREALFNIPQAILGLNPLPANSRAMAEFAARYRKNQLKAAGEEIVRKAAADNLARHGLVKAEARDLFNLLFPEGVKKTARTFLRPLEQLPEGRFLELRKRWSLLALVLPCSAVDLVCGLFLKAQKYRSGTGVEFSSSEMCLYRAVLAELADQTAGVIVDVPDDDTTTLSLGGFSSVDSSDATLTPTYVSNAIKTVSQTFAKQSLRRLRVHSQFRATADFIDSLESHLSKQSQSSASTTPTKGKIDLDGFTIPSFAPELYGRLTEYVRL